jgi:excisionase family DNA binding protein
MRYCMGNPHQSAAPDIDPLLTWAPIAERLKLKERAFWHAVHNGGLPFCRINSRVLRFRWSEVEQWLSARRQGAIA